MIREPTTSQEWSWLLSRAPMMLLLGDDELRVSPIGRWFLLGLARKRRLEPLAIRRASRSIATRGRHFLEGVAAETIRKHTQGRGAKIEVSK